MGVTSQTITKYESGANISDTIKRLIRYEFSLFLPQEERLAQNNEEKAHPAETIVTTTELIRHLKETVVELKEDKEFLKGLVLKNCKPE